MSKAEQKKFKEQMLRVQMNRISNEQQRKNFESALILILWYYTISSVSDSRD